MKPASILDLPDVLPAIMLQEGETVFLLEKNVAPQCPHSGKTKALFAQRFAPLDNVVAPDLSSTVSKNCGDR